MVHSIVPGMIAYKMLSIRASRALAITLNVLLFYKVGSVAMAEQFVNLRPAIAMVSSFLP